MSDRFASQLWIPLSLAYVVVTIVGVAFGLQTPSELIFFAQTVPGFTALAVVGTILASRRPRNPIGWLLLGAGLAAATYNMGLEASIYAVAAVPGSPFDLIPAFLALWSLTGFVILFALSVLVFPTGRMLSRRWRRLTVGVGLISLLGTAILLLAPADLGPKSGYLANPIYVSALAPLAGVAPLIFLLQLSPLALAMASLVVRYRRGSTVEKQQLKWILLAAVLMVASFIISAFPSPISGALNFAGLFVLPTAIGIAILRYRIFDIDHLINRTLVYGATSGVIATLFFAGIVALQPALRPLTEGTDLAVAASTLAAFALFQPIRRRIQDGVDRRFDRLRYDAARTLDNFSDALRDEVDLERVKADLLGAVATTMAPQHVSLWLRSRAASPVTISGRPVIRKELA